MANYRFTMLTAKKRRKPKYFHNFTGLTPSSSTDSSDEHWR